MIDLSTTYLGLNLKNPLVVSASPLCQKVENMVRMEKAGAAAIVLHSLFEEQIIQETQKLERDLTRGTESFPEALTYFPNMTSYNLGPEGYIEHIRSAKKAVGIPIIGSLNGSSAGGWLEYAEKIEAAGADALELNIYYIPTNFDYTGSLVEQVYVDLVREIKKRVKIPVAVKLGFSFSAMANMAKRLDEAGADALVLFNRFYQPDFDMDNLEVVPRLSLSNSHELLLRLHWVSILYGHIKADLAITGGIHTAADMIKSMMSGARVGMMTSALFINGIEYLEQLREALVMWMEKHEYGSIREMQGCMSQESIADPSAFERANYLKVLSSYKLGK